MVPPPPPPARRPAPGLRGRPGGTLLAALAVLAASPLAGCLCPPSDEALLAVGFRSPEQTVRTFQTGVRADEFELEYRCLSLAFVRANSLSKLVYLEFRDELFRQHPFLRSGLAKARVRSVETEGDRSRVTLESFGRTFQLELALEDFAQVWAGGELVLDRDARFDEWTSIAASGGERWITGGVPLPDGTDGREVTELRLGREWKIDHFLGETTDAAGPAGSAATP